MGSVTWRILEGDCRARLAEERAEVGRLQAEVAQLHAIAEQATQRGMDAEAEVDRLRGVEEAAQELIRLWDLGIDHPTLAEWKAFRRALEGSSGE